MQIRLLDQGAVGDGASFDTQAIQDSIDLISANGGGRLIFDSGFTFKSGSLVIKAGVELHLEANSVLLASGDYEDYLVEHSIPAITHGFIEETVLPIRAFISGYKAHEARISGAGTISGNADDFILKVGEHIHEMRAPKGGKSQYLERPFTIFLIDSQNVSLSDFTIRDPAFWALRLTGCNDLRIIGVKILTDLKVPNADGIDIDRCQRVTISGCELVTADDCISLKSCSETAIFGDVADVKISDCDMTTRSGAITSGTESVGNIRGVLVENCRVWQSHRGFAVRAREGGVIEGIVFRDSSLQTQTFSPSWWGHGEALHVTAFAWNEPGFLFGGNPERLLCGYVKDIIFENLEVTTEAGTLVWAQKRGLISGVKFRNITQRMEINSQWTARIDLRPNDVTPFVERSHNGFEIVNSDEVVLESVLLTWRLKDRANYGQVVHSENSSLQAEVTEISPREEQIS